MKKNIFKLKTKHLKRIAENLRQKIEEGLNEDGKEIRCLPTYITPPKTGVKGTSLVLDLGGTNYRTAKVDFSGSEPAIHPEDGWKRDLSVMRTEGFTQKELLEKLADPINEMNLDGNMPVGYCFSYPAESTLDGDAKLIRWTKGVNIREMLEQPVGKPLLDHLNCPAKKFSSIKVINDTVASLFAGLTKSGYDAYIGLIVGTGTNMAALMRPDKIKKLNPAYKGIDPIPVNLESGNFNPPYLTFIDDKVDACSDSKGRQRFEKAVSGMYLGEIFKSVFPYDEIEDKFDAQKLTGIMNYPDMYKKKYVQVARRIYTRSAQLVAASLAGLILVLASHEPGIRNVCLTAEGSLFWSKDKRGKDYNKLVLEDLNNLLVEFGHNEIQVDINKMENANLIGSAVAALS